MPMKYKVPVTWRVWGTYQIEADSKEEAIRKAYHATSLPAESEYIDDSLIVDKEDITCEHNAPAEPASEE